MINQIFFQRLESIYWKDNFLKIKEWLSCNRQSSFRINYLKSNKEEIESYLKNNKISFEILNINWYNFYLFDKINEFDFKWSTIFHSWKVYMQSISSMLPVLCFSDIKHDDIILDAFAAPWWKTTQISSIMENKWKIIACEKFMIRFDKLAYNIKNQWCNNVQLLKIDINNIDKYFKNESFNKIIADVPCSSEWKINLNNEKTFKHWNIDLILKKQKEQIIFCEKLLPLLKKWWEMIYSTCSMSKEENENVIEFILNKYKNIKISNINISSNNKIFESNIFKNSILKTIRISPSELTEWFFIAKLIKTI